MQCLRVKPFTLQLHDTYASLKTPDVFNGRITDDTNSVVCGDLLICDSVTYPKTTLWRLSRERNVRSKIV